MDSTENGVNHHHTAVTHYNSKVNSSPHDLYKTYTDIVKGMIKIPLQDVMAQFREKVFNHQYFRITSFQLESHVFFRYSVLRLAHDGFYKTPVSGEIQCFSCGLQCNILRDSSDPFGHHKSNAHCLHLQGKDPRNVPLQHQGMTFGNIRETPHGGDVSSRPTSSGRQHHQNGGHERMSDSVRNERTVTTDGSRRMNVLVESNQRVNHVDRRPPQRVITEEAARLRNTTPTHRRRNLQRTVTLRDYRYELCRFQSYAHWPSNAAANPEDLANAGFYYMGTDDRVQCPFCRGILRCWEPDDRPLAEHLRHFPQCPFLDDPQSTGNVALGDEDERLFTSVQMREVGDFRPDEVSSVGVVSNTSRHPDKAHTTTRLATFADFPSNAFQKPEDLAQAGFFYTGEVDRVCCFFCNVSISNWKTTDDPWYTHALKSETCGFILMSKGQQFIQEAKNTINKPRKKKTHKNNKKRNGTKHHVNERELDSIMSSSLVKSLSEEYDVQVIKKVVQTRLQDLGESFPNPESLMDAILEYEDQGGETESDEDLTLEEVEQSEDRNTGATGNVSGNVSGNVKRMRNIEDNSRRDDNGTDEILDEASLLQQQEELLAESRCKVCLDEQSCIVFLRCGHLVCCSSCAPALTKCPICREKILGTIRVDL